jgi:hypothetical protein
MEIVSGLLAFIIITAFLVLEVCALVGSRKRNRKIF